jgi:hypothetical protein
VKYSNAIWTKEENRRLFFDELANTIGLKEFEDWYVLTRDDISKNGGGGLLQSVYQNSLSTALRSIYPQHEWLPWKFKKVPVAFWEDKGNQNYFFSWLDKVLQIKDMDDWYRVSLEQIYKVAPLTMFIRKGFPNLLGEVYPHHKWSLDKLNHKKTPIKAAQRMLAIMIQSLFPNFSRILFNN